MLNKIIWEYLDCEHIICDDNYPQSITLISQGRNTQLYTVSDEISLFFDLDKDDSRHLLKEWLYYQGINEPQCGWDSLFIGPRILKTKWSPELSQDLSVQYSIDAEAELTALLVQQISAEIDSITFDSLTSEIKNTTELLTVMDDIGYTRAIIYDPNTFEPTQRFVKKDLF